MTQPAEAEIPRAMGESVTGSCPVGVPMITAIALCEERNELWKKEMEDVSIIIKGYGRKEGTSFFAIFDGFHGRAAAEIASREFPVLLLEQLCPLDPALSLDPSELEFLGRMNGLFLRENRQQSLEKPEDIGEEEDELSQAFSTAFSKMDRLLSLGRNETSRSRWSGCSALVCLIDGVPLASKAKCQDTENKRRKIPNNPLQEPAGPKIHVANCGNVHALLYKEGMGFLLTKDHSTSNPKERKRVLSVGGRISGNKLHGLVEGLSRATRGLGHFGDRRLKRAVIPVPTTVSMAVELSSQVLILASSGLWEVLDQHAVENIIRKLIELHAGSRERERPDEACQMIPACSRSERGNEEMTKEHRKLQKSCSWVKNKSQGNSYKDTLNKQHLANCICQELARASVAAGLKENISVMVVLLQGSEL